MKQNVRAVVSIGNTSMFTAPQNVKALPCEPSVISTVWSRSKLTINKIDLKRTAKYFRSQKSRNDRTLRARDTFLKYLNHRSTGMKFEANICPQRNNFTTSLLLTQILPRISCLLTDGFNISESNHQLKRRLYFSSLEFPVLLPHLTFSLHRHNILMNFVPRRLPGTH